jgi:phosphatidate cytidylyltransferase
VQKSNLGIRLITAAVVAPLLSALMFLGPAWGWYLLILISSAVAAIELFSMTHPDDRPARAIGVMSSLAVSLVVYFYSRDARALLTMLLAVPMLGILVPLLKVGSLATAALRVMAGVAGPLYIGALLTTLALLRRDFDGMGRRYLLLALTLAWLGDTGGYFFGRFFGKSKLYEAVSPNKTWAGLVGSLLGALLSTLAAHFLYLPGLSLSAALALALVAGTLGQLGDLVESLLKRSTGVKDSGWIVPGHGGLLDRIDALLVVSPIVYLYALWFGS